jgi:hypothetical protein
MMGIEKLNMADYLGRGIQVYLNNGQALYFKPMELKDNDTWIGQNEESATITIKRDEIMFVKR